MRKGVDLREKSGGESVLPVEPRTQPFRVLAEVGLDVFALGVAFIVFLKVDLAAGLGALFATWGLTRLLPLGGRRHGPLGVAIPMVAGVALVALGAAILPTHKATPKPGASAPPAATAAPVPSVTPSPTLEQLKEQARQAVLRYLDVYAQAEKTLDPTLLASIAGGQVLQYSQASVEHDRALNQPWLLKADRTFTSIVIAQGLGGPNLGAQVNETYVDHSVRLDPHTLQPIDPDPNRHAQDFYTLQEVAPGQWKVVFSTEVN